MLFLGRPLLRFPLAQELTALLSNEALAAHLPTILTINLVALDVGGLRRDWTRLACSGPPTAHRGALVS